MTRPISVAAPSAWNAGAWFGSQIGATLWLAISAFVLAYRGARALAAVVFGLFLLANAVGAWLWRTRERRPIGSGFGILVVTFWVSGLAAIVAIDRAGQWDSLAIGGPNVSAMKSVVMLTVISAALFFFLRRRLASVERS
jgi:hypothetical protein